MSHEDQGSCTPEASKHLTDEIAALKRQLEDVTGELKLWKAADRSAENGRAAALIRELAYSRADFNESANIAQRRQMELERLLADRDKAHEATAEAFEKEVSRANSLEMLISRIYSGPPAEWYDGKNDNPIDWINQQIAAWTAP